MTLSRDHDFDPTAPRPPIPRSVKKAVAFMRASAGRPISMDDLVRHCDVAERTLNKHFRTFLGQSPMRYLQRLRLAAAREALLAGRRNVSVTAVAKSCGFNHFGRFADLYRRHFGEAPSTTLRRGQATACTVPTDQNRRERRLPLLSRERPTLAILPCLAPIHEPAQHWLAESIADAIAAALSSFRALAVTRPQSHRAAERDPQRLGRELGARYVLTGRLTRAGTRLRVIFNVAESASGHHVWGDCLDGECDRPLELQDRIVSRLVNAILPSIRNAEIDRAQRSLPQNLDAHGLAMRALPLVFASQPDATRRALELLHRAIEIDPDYGLTTALAAWGHGQLVMYNGTAEPAEERTRAMELVQRAAILDDGDPLVLTARCAVHMMAQEFDVAEALVARALALDPMSAWAWGRSAWLHAYQGNSEMAIAHFGRAVALDPNSASRANSYAGIGAAHFNAGRYAAAAQWVRRAQIEQPGTWWANRTLSVSYARLGERLKAIEALDMLQRFRPDLSIGQVRAAVPFRESFLDRLGEGLSDLGLPP